MAINAKHFQVIRMICTTAAQFERVVNMTFIQPNLCKAVIAKTPIPLVNKLPNFTPFVFWHSVKPGIMFTIQQKSYHTSPIPHRTAHHQTKHHLTTPYTTVPDSNHKERTLPCLAIHRLATPHPTQPRITVPDQNRKGEPCHTPPNLTRDRRTVHGNNLERLTTTTNLFHQLKAGDHKSAKLGAVVPDTNSLTRKDKGVVEDFKGKLIIQDGDSKGEYPSGFEHGANAKNAGTHLYHRAGVKIQAIVGIIIKRFRAFNAVQNFKRFDDYVSDKQVLVGFSALARYLEVRGGLSQCALKVAGGLKDLIILIYVEMFLPFIRVILCPRAFLASFGSDSRVHHRISVLNQRGCALNYNFDRIHDIAPSETQSDAILLVRHSCRRKVSFQQNRVTMWANKKPAFTFDLSILPQNNPLYNGNYY